MTARYTHVGVQANDLDESVRLYESAFGTARLPTPDFEETIQWLRYGDVQLHLVETDADAPTFNHHALRVDGFEATYRALAAEGAAFEALRHLDAGFVDGAPPVYVLPTGAVQLYVRDPADDLAEVNAPDADDVDRGVVTNLVERSDVEPPEPGAEPAVLNGRGLLASIGLDVAG